MWGWISKFPKTFSSAKKSPHGSRIETRRGWSQNQAPPSPKALRLEFPKPPEEVPGGLQTFFLNHEIDRCIIVVYVFVCNCLVPSKNRLLLPGFLGKRCAFFSTNPSPTDRTNWDIWRGFWRRSKNRPIQQLLGHWGRCIVCSWLPWTYQRIWEFVRLEKRGADQTTLKFWHEKLVESEALMAGAGLRTSYPGSGPTRLPGAKRLPTLPFGLTHVDTQHDTAAFVSSRFQLNSIAEFSIYLQYTEQNYITRDI